MIGLALLNGEKVSVGFAGVVWKLLVGGLDEDPEREMEVGTRRRGRDEIDGLEGGIEERRGKRRKGRIEREDLKGVDDELERSLKWVQ